MDFTTLPSWKNCTRVLERHCQYLESIDNTHISNSSASGTKSAIKPRNQHRGYTFSYFSISCQFCSTTGHTISNCERLKSMNTTQHFDQIKKMGLCINCFSKGHQVVSYPSTHRCKITPQPPTSRFKQPDNNSAIDFTGTSHTYTFEQLVDK